MNKPTTDQLNTTMEVLEWLEEYTQKTEPYAKSFIDACSEVILSMPEECDLEDMP